MTSRDQLTNERLDALIEVLTEQGVLDPDWRDALENTRELGQGQEVAEAARQGQGPPDFVREGPQ